EINLKKYREIIESSLYSHFGLKDELSRKVIKERDLKKANMLFQNHLASQAIEKKLIERELEYFKNQEVAYYEDVLNKEKILASLKSNIKNMSKSFEAQKEYVEKISKKLKSNVKENRKLQKQYEDKIAQINKRNISEVEKIREEMNHVYDEKHRIEILNASLSKTIKSIKRKMAQTQQQSDMKGDQEKVAQILNSQLTVALDQRGKTEDQLLSLENKISGLENQLSYANKKIQGKNQVLSSLLANQLNIERNLASYQEELTRKAKVKEKIIDRIKSAFGGNGSRTSLDRKNGDITFNFDRVYFDFGSYNLKTEMKDDLEEFISRYAKAVMGDKNLSNTIKEIEIIGSASPTYKGRFVNMILSDEKTIKKAMSLNLDLSYKRAKNIFDHLFNNPEVNFEHKDEMYPLLKVSGEGFHRGSLPKGETYESLGETSDFCFKFDCTKYQVVKISFKLK
ncbi:MAG: hypothetical protein OEY33_02625, partial [Bdellovibrionales bacterium]|nr:hypothetical protein [Bdellovibrionales bacterium]